jgi:hypothetical protein
MQTRRIHEKNLLVSLGVKAGDKLDILRAEFNDMADFASRLSSCHLNELGDSINP